MRAWLAVLLARLGALAFASAPQSKKFPRSNLTAPAGCGALGLSRLRAGKLDADGLGREQGSLLRRGGEEGGQDRELW